MTSLLMSTMGTLLLESQENRRRGAKVMGGEETAQVDSGLPRVNGGDIFRLVRRIGND